MRVLVFLHSFEPGGVERVALRLCKAWANDGIDVKLVLGRADGIMADEAGSLPFTVLSEGRFPTAAWETLWMIMRLPGIVRRERPDVLFCAGNSYSIVSVAMKIWLGRSCPPIVAKISNDLVRADFPAPLRWAYYRWLRIQARLIDTFVGMAPPMRREIAGSMKLAPSKVAIIDDPALSIAEINRFATDRLTGRQRHRFVAAGRLVGQKNFAMLLRAFAQIARDDDSLTILGDGPERSKLERLAQSLGLADRVTFAGYVGDLALWFADAEIFVLSSAYEGVPAVIAEALAAGLAIVATDASVSMADMLGYGRYGQIVRSKNADDLAAALDRSRSVVLDPAGMMSMAKRFTVEKAGPAYLAVFEDAIRVANHTLVTKDHDRSVPGRVENAGLKP